MNLTIKKFKLFRKSEIQFVQDNLKVIFQSILTVLSLALAVWFFRHEQAELHQVKHVLSTSKWEWTVVGTLLTLFYIALQALMYISSFAAIGTKLSLSDAIILFLKRNFVSVFLPAGGISSLAFFSKPIEDKGITKTQVHFASSIYAFVGILSVVIVAVPAFLVALSTGGVGYGEWIALSTTIILIISAYAFYRSFQTQGFLYNKLIDRWPVAQEYLDDLISNKIQSKYFLLTVFYSVVIELTGIAHLYISMLALHLEPSLSVAILGYITSVILLIVSPFLRGIGAIEFSMTYVLVRFGFSNVDAISVTFFYRFFEFWLPLLLGAFSFLIKINKLILRIFPAMLLFVLGIINIISVATPAIGTRLHFLKEFLPMSAISVSNFFVLLTGLFLLVTAAFLLKGLRMAWYFAIGLCIVSIVGNLTKAFDYEESILSLVVAIVLLISKKEYYIKNSRRSGIMGIVVTSLSCLAVVIYGCAGFYFLDEKHFGIDFSLKQSIPYTLLNFFLVGSPELIPRDNFARDFIISLNISGFISIAFLIYALIRPYLVDRSVYEDDLEWAKTELDKYGNSALDYFKSYTDKLIFAPKWQTDLFHIASLEISLWFWNAP